MAKAFLAWLLLSLAVAVAPAAALAQALPAEPLPLVQSFYKPGFDENAMPLSTRLGKLLDAAIANSRKHNAPVTGLDFAWTINAQDAEQGYEKTLRFEEVVRESVAATVRVTFHNGRDEELRYELLREGGKWVVNDIHYVSGDSIRLSRMLEIGARETP